LEEAGAVDERAEVRGIPEAATPVVADDPADDPAHDGAVEALEAAPDVDDVSDGEPTSR
jgi:hypothetical protein